MNPAGIRLLGYTPFPIEALPVTRALHGETVQGSLIGYRRPRDGRHLWGSVSAAPFRTPEGQLVGAVSILTDVTTLHELQEQREDLLRTISHELRTRLTIIQGHAQILRQLRSVRMSKRADRFRALEQAALSITTELSLDAVLKKIVDTARDLVHARYAALGVAREDLKGLSNFVVSGVTNEEIAAIGNWPRGLGLLGELLRNPQPLRARVISEHPGSIGFPPHHPKMTSFLGVPIISKGRILGNFYLTDKIGAKEFTKEHEELIVAFAAFAAIAIDNARLYAETDIELRRKIQEAERREQQLSFLVELSAILPSGPITEEIPFEDVLAKTTGLLGDACGAYLVHPDGHVTRKTFIHRDPARAKAAEDIVDDTWNVIRGQVIDKNRTVFVADVDLIAAPTPTENFEAKEMREHKFSAAMVLPIRSAAQTYGVFISLGSRPLAFTRDDFSFGMLVAQRLGTAIENSLLLRQLKDALKMRDEFISIATHELKTPVTVLMSYADLAMRFGPADPERLRTALETIKRQSTRLGDLTNDLLDLSRIKAGRLELHRERLSLSDLAAEAINRFAAQLDPQDKARLKLHIAMPQPWVEGDPQRLEQVVVNLLSNAYKYSPQGGDVEVRVDKLDHQARFSVTDHGVGIPRDQQARIFEPFFRATTATQAKASGAGLGLSISKEIVEQHGGRMWFESEEDKGSTFYFTLPLA